MRNLKIKFVSLLILLFALLQLPANGLAVGLDGIQFKPGLRIGIFHGTFDPPHIGHDRVANSALASGALDYVLFVPNDLAFYKPNATSYELRWQMSSELYADSARIVVPEVLGSEKPMLDLALEWIRQRAPDATFVGIIGSDNATAKYEEGVLYKSVDAFIDEWLVNLRQGERHEGIPTSIIGKPVRQFQSNDEGISSTAVRRALVQGDARIPLYPRVLSFIQRHGLYGATVKTCDAIFSGIR